MTCHCSQCQSPESKERIRRSQFPIPWSTNLESQRADWSDSDGEQQGSASSHRNTHPASASTASASACDFVTLPAANASLSRHDDTTGSVNEDDRADFCEMLEMENQGEKIAWNSHGDRIRAERLNIHENESSPPTGATSSSTNEAEWLA